MIPEQPVIFVVHHGVTFAYGIFQFFAIQHGNMAAAILDRSDRLQFESSLSHTFPANTQHDGYLLMCHLHFIARQPIKTHQQKTAQLLLDIMMAIAYRVLRGLSNQCLGITQYHML